MSTDASPLVVIEGLFLLHHPRGLIVQTHQGEVVSLAETLNVSLGKEVSVALHYAPPNPPVVGLPGFGACCYLSSCKIHREDPEFLFSLSGEGVLTSTEEGNFLVGGLPLRLAEIMSGHYGRLVLIQKAPPEDLSLLSTLDQVAAMADLLKALQKEIS